MIRLVITWIKDPITATTPRTVTAIPRTTTTAAIPIPSALCMAAGDITAAGFAVDSVADSPAVVFTVVAAFEAAAVSTAAVVDTGKRSHLCERG